MSRYQVVFTSSAEKELSKLERKVQEEIAARIRALADDPYSGDCRKLEGAHDLYRLRSGKFRVLYSVDGEVVRVVAIRDRKDAYKKR